MIAIDVTMFPIGVDASVGQEYTMPFVSKEYTAIVAFFQNCIEQSIILNLVDYEQFYDHDVTIYFSPDMEKAQLFEQKFQDLTAEFSMKKLWNQVGLDTSIAFREIDFDTLKSVTELINPDLSQMLWGISIA